MEKYWELTEVLPNATNQAAVNDYLLSLKLGNYSQGTIVLYRQFLGRFFSECPESFASLSSEAILNWFQQHESQVKDITYKLRLSVLSSFYTFCVREEKIEKSPIKTRWFPRLPQPIPKYLEKGEIAKMRQQSEETTYRNQAIVEFLLTSGCRVAELVGLNRDHINLETRTAHVVGKGRKIREVHFSEKCALFIERYLASQKKAGEALFVSSNGKRLGIRRIQIIIQDIGEEAQLKTQLHPHRLRHTFATELLSKGAELSFIADELGHTNISTTQIYARLPQEKIVSLYRKYMG
ncbi:hypothetical protein A9986_07910 [Solibacillus silvestris]|nr:tyrosine-type recombinase/integrase [Solibacillus silvestris]OBW58860.1 hypothetical protein A9986_07910 [Solibacillus silvestris]